MRTSTEQRRQFLAAANPAAADEFADINWFHTVLLTVTPALALYGYLTTPLTWPTLVLAIVWYFATGLGITAGYHRLFAHRAYQATNGVRATLLAFGAAAFQGSAAWWCRAHVLHHRFTDTPKDPYNVHKGFWWAHLGWMITQMDKSKWGKTNIAFLKNDPMVSFQHKHYVKIALTVGIVVPTLIGAAYGDAWGAFFYACMLRMVFVHHATFFVNSLAHTVGAKPFSHLTSASDSIITAVLTLGEGFHNYHHVFPSDYRNAIKYHQYDPTKWLIAFLSYFGLTYGLRRIDDEEIDRARDFVATGCCHQPPQDPALPPISVDLFRARVAAGEALIVIEGTVYDVKPFALSHPGGYATVMNEVGKDATAAFRGEERSSDTSLNRHTQEARAILKTLAIARLDGMYRLPVDHASS
ncbi:delta-9 desaturase [Thecamonas trahens ATCC 50062]|uniref:Delta-9 desaturase n=1 Tax=Thecamonas trahens ATCC 50062 TaxID=461836 RepID=A0A0L0DJ06_THETB|nr:delta-9 desaturase [Thecamonas trahens ATCC 50062]KNC52180.1 delta-9 desaturase [Thecamonas trahens ATCC 50062]|eukprot:XP_013762183.1 delta-9 desaturase [Thecamonas trahens ATCC 50062]